MSETRVVAIETARTFTLVTDDEIGRGNCEAFKVHRQWVDRDMLRLLSNEARSRYVTAPPEKKLPFWLAVRLTLNEHSIYDKQGDKKRARYKTAIFMIFRARAETHRKAQERLKAPKVAAPRLRRAKGAQIIPVILDERTGQYGLVI